MLEIPRGLCGRTSIAREIAGSGLTNTGEVADEREGRYAHLEGHDEALSPEVPEAGDAAQKREAALPLRC
jgi:hypothetical protein